MTEIQWSPTGVTADGSGFRWMGFTPKQFDYYYTRIFTGRRYAQIKRTPGERTTPDNAADLYREMRNMLPLEEGPDVPYHDTIP